MKWFCLAPSVVLLAFNPVEGVLFAVFTVATMLLVEWLLGDKKRQPRNRL